MDTESRDKYTELWCRSVEMSEKLNLKVAKKKRGGHKGWATSLATEISEKLSTETEREELLALKKSLEEKLENLKSLDDEILNLLCEDEDVDDDEKDEGQVPQGTQGGDDNAQENLHRGPGLSQLQNSHLEQEKIVEEKVGGKVRS